MLCEFGYFLYLSIGLVFRFGAVCRVMNRIGYLYLTNVVKGIKSTQGPHTYSVSQPLAHHVYF